MLIKRCSSVCSACSDYSSDNCTTCTDANRISNYTGYVGTCVCYGSGVDAALMYEEGTANTCVYICPALPV